jgi:esterase/lipase superfamily enzyme
LYIIRNNRSVRRQTNYIILTHARNLIQDFYIDPVVIHGNNKFTWGIWQRYFIEDLKKDLVPCHYFVEQLSTDYVIYRGMNEFQPSYFVEDLVSASIIDYKYRNSLLVVIGDDFSINTVEERMAQHLSDKLLTGLMKQYNLDFTRIKYIDDCLKPEWKENFKYSSLEYKYTEEKYFDFQTIKTNLDKYKKI